MAVRVVVTPSGEIDVEEFTLPELGQREVAVQTEVASGKHGTMTALLGGKNFNGQRFDESMRMFTTDERSDRAPATPWVLGTTGVGVVTRVGAGVTCYKPGDRVCGLMKVASENICDESTVWSLGDAEPLDALCIEPAYVSIHAIRESHVRFGDTVAVFGLGAIGLIAVQLAHKSGAGKVIAVDPLENRRAWALSHGADAAVDPDSEDAAYRTHELTGGHGVDVAIESSGSYPALEGALKSTRMRGTVCAAGFYQGEAKSLWLGREFHHNRLNMIAPHGCGWGHEPRDYPRWDQSRAYGTIVEMIQKKRVDFSGLIDPLVGPEEMPRVVRQIYEAPGTVIKYGVRFAHGETKQAD